MVEEFFKDPDEPCRNLRHLLRSICLRRTSQKNSQLTASHEVIHLSLAKKERQFYDKTLEQTKMDIDAAVKTGQQGHKYTKLFALILRLRMLCNHGSRSQRSYTACETSKDTLSAVNSPLQISKDMGCDMCSDQDTVDLFVDPDVCPSCARVLTTDLTSIGTGSTSTPRKRRKLSPSVSKDDSLEEPISTMNLPHRATSGMTFPSEAGSTKLQAVKVNLQKHTSSSKRQVEPLIYILVIPTDRLKYRILLLDSDTGHPRKPSE